MTKFDLLRCPVCRADLALVGRSLRCPQRHSFDLARSGYVNLLTGHGAVPAEGGDDAQQLSRRDAFLGKGYFDGIVDTIRRNLPGDFRTVLDAGCGTAHHLKRLIGDRADVITAGIDVSKDAANFCAKRYPEIAFAVADIWREWPVRDACVDVVLSIFAPKNFSEAARVLRPGGFLAVAYPGPDHLIELRRAFDLLDQGEAKTEIYASGMAEVMSAPWHQRIYVDVQLPGEDVIRAILMGPNAKRAAGEVNSATRRVVFDIELLIARKPL
jgi:23S rRNA (guanine745-N1)-methyltransferase